MKNLKKKRKGGFTLIELIVVIAILGILAAIAVPRFANISSDAEVTSRQASARTILSAVSMAQAKYSTDTPSNTQINEFLTGITVEAGTGASDSASQKWSVNPATGQVYYNGAEVVLPKTATN